MKRCRGVLGFELALPHRNLRSRRDSSVMKRSPYQENCAEVSGVRSEMEVPSFDGLRWKVEFVFKNDCVLCHTVSMNIGSNPSLLNFLLMAVALVHLRCIRAVLDLGLLFVYASGWGVVLCNGWEDVLY